MAGRYEVGADAFFEAASRDGAVVRAVRTFASLVCRDADGGWGDEPHVRVVYRVDVETAEGPGVFACTEHLRIEEPTGIIVTAGTLWRRLRDARVPVLVERIRSGAI
jgi:hypothetical protein